jgi:hypothetical protein
VKNVINGIIGNYGCQYPLGILLLKLVVITNMGAFVVMQVMGGEHGEVILTLIKASGATNYANHSKSSIYIQVDTCVALMV